MLPRELWFRAANTVARAYGPRGLVLRATHEARRTVGAFRRNPTREVAWRGEPGLFRIDPAALRETVDRASTAERGNRVAGGEYEAFRWDWRALPSGDGWLSNPATGRRYDEHASWWTIEHLDEQWGDVKQVWEPARFGWAYDLVRAAVVTGESRYAHAFRRVFRDWASRSPPFRGVHWSCGQETSIRATALLYAEANLDCADAAPSIARVLAASGERIADALGYAISQRNNHGISEAAALVVLGVRFRGAHRDAAVWLARGRRLLARQLREQFASDGWYTQHSFNYLRLALDQCAVAEMALRSVGGALPPFAVARLRAAVTLLHAVIEPSTGAVPNHGANDGAFVHPITSAAYRDFRPILTAVCALWTIPMSVDLAPCAETLAWLNLDPPPVGPPLVQGVQCGPSGWAAARVGRTQVFLRAGRYTSRPGHIDPLHVDVRFGAEEVVVDPGTFTYNAPAPWNNALAGARVHDGPLIDDEDPGVRGPRFIWFSWPHAALLKASDGPGWVSLAAQRGGRVRREVMVKEGEVVVCDELMPGATGTMSVCWLLHPGAACEALTTSAGTCTVLASEADPRGWYSPVYGLRLPTRAVVARRDAGDRSPIVTTIVDRAKA